MSLDTAKCPLGGRREGEGREGERDGKWIE
jgi:hypothetical protein